MAYVVLVCGLLRDVLLFGLLCGLLCSLLSVCDLLYALHCDALPIRAVLIECAAAGMDSRNGRLDVDEARMMFKQHEDNHMHLTHRRARGGIFFLCGRARGGTSSTRRNDAYTLDYTKQALAAGSGGINIVHLVHTVPLVPLVHC